MSTHQGTWRTLGLAMACPTGGPVKPSCAVAVASLAACFLTFAPATSSMEPLRSFSGPPVATVYKLYSNVDSCLSANRSNGAAVAPSSSSTAHIWFQLQMRRQWHSACICMCAWCLPWILAASSTHACAQPRLSFLVRAAGDGSRILRAISESVRTSQPTFMRPKRDGICKSATSSARERRARQLKQASHSRDRHTQKR